MKSSHAHDAEPVLAVRDLQVMYATAHRGVLAVRGVSFEVRREETLGLVGESGSGKSTTAMAVLRLLSPPGRVVGGEVRLQGLDLLRIPERDLRRVRWRQISLVPQGAMNSLNPVMRIGDQIRDAIEAHEGHQPPGRLRSRVSELLETVRLDAGVARMFPHELSGGMKQRVCIAMAIALNPALVIADEPTSALDVVVQRAVAQTLLTVKRQLGMSMVLIGHDMGLQSQMVDRVAVMYRGHIVEIGPVLRVFEQPVHPYTQHLIASVPSLRARQPLRAAPSLDPEEVRFEVGRLEEVGPEHFAAVGRREG